MWVLKKSNRSNFLLKGNTKNGNMASLFNMYTTIITLDNHKDYKYGDVDITLSCLSTSKRIESNGRD